MPWKKKEDGTYGIGKGDIWLWLRKRQFKDGKAMNYTRSHPYPEHIFHFNPLPREKAAIVILRKKGYRIQELAKFLGRSTSFIHRVLTRNYMLGLRKDDKRKMPCKTKKYWRFKRWAKLVALWEKWEMWILGEGDKPP